MEGCGIVCTFIISSECTSNQFLCKFVFLQISKFATPRLRSRLNGLGPALVERANWNGEVASNTAWENCWASVRATNRRTKSPTTMPRTPPVWLAQRGHATQQNSLHVESSHHCVNCSLRAPAHLIADEGLLCSTEHLLCWPSPTTIPLVRMRRFGHGTTSKGVGEKHSWHEHEQLPCSYLLFYDACSAGLRQLPGKGEVPGNASHDFGDNSHQTTPAPELGGVCWPLPHLLVRNSPQNRRQFLRNCRCLQECGLDGMELDAACV